MKHRGWKVVAWVPWAALVVLTPGALVGFGCGDDPGSTAKVDGGAPTDGAAEPDGAVVVHCEADTACGEERGCLAGICRDLCWLGMSCSAGPPYDTCYDATYCVECVADTDCTGGNLRCNQTTFFCEPRPLDPAEVVVGVMYHQWWTPDRWQSNPPNYAYEPVLGHYDNANPTVVAQHLDWAQQAGVNTFVMDTWITDRDWWWVSANSVPVMDGLDARGMKYFLLVDGWFEFELAGGGGALDGPAIAAKVNERFATWVDRPGYLKVNGRPVIFFWAAWGKPCTLFDEIRAGIEAVLGPVYLTGNNGETDCWDRVMMYNPYTTEAGDYATQIAWQNQMWEDREQDGFPWAPTTSPGYDDTHVRDGNPPVPLDPTYFRDSIRAALAYNQHHRTPWLFVCSWSEWHEGSQIEPSSDFANPQAFLEVLHDELEAAGWL